MEFNQKEFSQKLLNNLHTAVEITKTSLSDFANLVEENIEDKHAVKSFDEFIRLSSEYVTAIDNLSSCFTVELNWIPSRCFADAHHNDQNKISQILPSPLVKMQYADGNTPWCFWLSFEPSPDFELLQTTLLNEWKQGNLRNLPELPPVGSYVICHDRVVVFRGIVLNTNVDKVKVRNVDSTCVKFLKLDNIYYMKKKFNTVHAQTVQCCLTKDNSLQGIWNADLSELFKNTLKESNLEVSFAEECGDCLPAKFLVHMRTCGEVVVDLNQWICSKMLPELVKYQDRPEELMIEYLSDEIIDPYYNKGFNKLNKYDDGNNKSLVKMSESLSSAGWSSQLIHSNPLLPSIYLAPSLTDYPESPHLAGHIMTPPGAITAQYTTTTVFSGSNIDGSSNSYPIPQQMTTTSSFILKPGNTSNTILNVNTPCFEPRKKIGPFITELSDTSSTKSTTNLRPLNDTKGFITEIDKAPSIAISSSKSTKHLNTEPKASRSIEISSNSSSSVKPGSDTKTKTPKIATDLNEICPVYCKNGFCLSSNCTKRHVKESSSKSQKSVSEPAPKSVNQVKVGTADDEQDEDDDDLEEPCINGGYVPRDEARLCRFPIKANGKCWKQQCNKEHEEISTHKWTTDKCDALNGTFNFLDLPELDDTIELVVTSIINPYTFYARLPDVYSDIGEGVENIETFVSLHKSLNDLRNIKNYQLTPGIDPADGEIYLVQARDNFWKRGLILEKLVKKSVKVFYIDYGCNEVVNESSLRLMEDRFNHLPAQAVRCTLHNLHCGFEDNDLRRRGTKCLEVIINGKVITGKVATRNEEETSLGLLVTFKEWNVNKLMVQKGYCDQIRNTHE